MLQTALRPSCMNRASVLSGKRDSRKAVSLWGVIRGVGWVKKSIDQSWLAKELGLGLGLGLICWGFKGVKEEIPSEEASSLQIGSVAFPRGQYTSPQLHPCHRLFDQDGHQDSLLYCHLLIHAEIYIYIYWIHADAMNNRRNDKDRRTQEDFFNKIFTSHFIARVRKGLLKVCAWEGAGDRI